MKAIAAVLVLSLTCSAELPDAPKPKAFTRSTIVELSLAAGAMSADAVSSYKVANEINPLVRSVENSKAALTAYFGIGFAGLVTGNYFLRNHHKIRHVLNWSVIGTETFWAVHNSNQQKAMCVKIYESQHVVVPPCHF